MYDVPVSPYKSKICKVCNKAPIWRYEENGGEDYLELFMEREYYEDLSMCRGCVRWESVWYTGEEWVSSSLSERLEMDFYNYFGKYKRKVVKGWEYVEDDYFGRGARWRVGL